MHGHVQVWHQQSPVWMNTTKDAAGNSLPLGRDEALANLQTHIKTVVEHFGDKVISWDVVNEAMSDNPGNPADWETSLRESPWKSSIGADYVEQAFLAAREVLDQHPDWNIKLYYNDYNEDNQNKAAAIYNMVKAINDRYALTHPGKRLIDGVGMQGHYSVNTNPENVKLSLEKFISLGVEVSITELDIQAGSNNQLSEKLANAQGYLYAQLMELFKTHAANIERVTFWGLDDHTSWRASANPLLFDKNLQAKPAYYGVINPGKFMEEHKPDSTGANQSTAVYASPVVDGTVDAVWSKAPELPVYRYQMAWQGATGVAKTLWDDQNLYVLIQVSDAQLDKSSKNIWEQDSVEIFLDENNGKTTFYQDDDGQFRVNFDNGTSFNPAGIAGGFESSTKVAGTNYTVEVKIPFKKISASNDRKIGFDVQINDAKDGARQSVAAWNDTTGNGYQDTSVYGVLTLTGKPGQSNEGGNSNNNNTNSSNGSTPQAGNVGSKDGVVTGNLSWAKQAVAAMAARDIVKGTPKTSFSPETAMNRADFTVLLVRALELKGTDQDSAAFSDVQKDADYRNELAIAKQLGIVTGYEGNMFKPNSELSRQDMMVIAYRALAAAGKKASGSATLESYSDADRIADYARDSLAALVKFGIVSGKDGKLAPDDTLTRAEAAVIVYRIWNL